MITLYDISRILVESQENTPSENIEEWIAKRMNMDPAVAEAMMESLMGSALDIFAKNVEETTNIVEAASMALKTALVGTLLLGMDIEREFGQKTSLEGIGRDA